MATASERNQRALAKLIRDRRIAEARQRKREAQTVLRNSDASKDQRYRARQKIKNADVAIQSAGIIAQASQWEAYRRTFTPRARNARNAELWMQGFGSMGATGIANRHGGFLATEAQREARAELERLVHRESVRTMPSSDGVLSVEDAARYFADEAGKSLAMKQGRVYDLNDDFWNVWREQYADTFL